MIDPAVTALAATQHGLLSRAQLIDLGIPRRRWRRGIEEGWLSVAGRGVYAVAGSPESLTRRLWLGLLVLGPTAVVSHEAAAWSHGFDRCVDDRAEFTVPRARRSAGVGLLVHSTRSLPAVDRTHVGGLACTSATRTILDLAATGITTGRLEAAIDSAVRSGATSPVVLQRRLQQRRGPGQAGTALLERDLPDSGGHSPLERRFLALMRTAGLPARGSKSCTAGTGARSHESTLVGFRAARPARELTGAAGTRIRRRRGRRGAGTAGGR